MNEVVTTDEFRAWYVGLGDADADAVTFVVGLIESQGLSLGSPYSSALAGTKYALRELRPKAGRSSLRIVYAFDPTRDAVLIIGGDKAGDPKFYKRIIRKAEAIWVKYLEERDDTSEENDDEAP